MRYEDGGGLGVGLGTRGEQERKSGAFGCRGPGVKGGLV